MAVIVPGLLQPSEYHPGSAAYIAKAQAFADPVQKLAEQLKEVSDLLSPLDPVRAHYRYAPGKWSVQELLGHITDAERIFAARALHVARADPAPLPGWEENAYVAAAEAERCPFDELLAEFGHVRQASVLMFRHLPEQAWPRQGVVNGAASSVRAIAYVMIGHVAHHLEVLRERYLHAG